MKAVLTSRNSSLETLSLPARLETETAPPKEKPKTTPEPRKPPAKPFQPGPAKPKKPETDPNKTFPTRRHC